MKCIEHSVCGKQCVHASKLMRSLKVTFEVLTGLKPWKYERKDKWKDKREDKKKNKSEKERKGKKKRKRENVQRNGKKGNKNKEVGEYDDNEEED